MKSVDDQFAEIFKQAEPAINISAETIKPNAELRRWNEGHELAGPDIKHESEEE